MAERLIAITGPMFSGKTTELMRLVDRAEHADWCVQLFKPVLDNRWERDGSIRSHTGREREAIPIATPGEIFPYLNGDTQMVAIDEIQFFDSEVVPVVEKLVNLGIEVVFAGLPLDFRGETFGSMGELLTRATEKTSLSTICKYETKGKICGKDASRTQRLVNGKPANYTDPIVLLEANESYTARCIRHHQVPGKP